MDVRRKNQEISRMGFTSQLFKFETKMNCGSSKYIANKTMYK